MGVERFNKYISAYDYVIKGKEVPKEVDEATIARINELKSTIAKISKLPNIQEQYRECIRNGIPFNWPLDDHPAGKPSSTMEGGVPNKKEP